MGSNAIANLDDEILTLREAATFLACSYSCVYRLMRQRDFPVFKLGTMYRVQRSELLKWIEARTVGDQ